MNKIEFKTGYIEINTTDADKILISIGAYQLGGKENIVNSADLSFEEFEKLVLPILKLFSKKESVETEDEKET